MHSGGGRWRRLVRQKLGVKVWRGALCLSNKCFFPWISCDGCLTKPFLPGKTFSLFLQTQDPTENHNPTIENHSPTAANHFPCPTPPPPTAESNRASYLDGQPTIDPTSNRAPHFNRPIALLCTISLSSQVFFTVVTTTFFPKQQPVKMPGQKQRDFGHQIQCIFTTN